MNSFVALLGLLAVLLPVSASARLEGGEYIVLGFYAIDVGYAPKEPNVGDTVSLEFQLQDAQQQSTETFSHMVLRIENDQTVQFSGKLLSDGDRVALTQRFERAGTYLFNLQFFEGEKELVAYSFPLVIPDPSEEQSSFWDVMNISEATPRTLTPWLAGILIGLILGALLMMGKREIS
jgi:hypothetical protein